MIGPGGACAIAAPARNNQAPLKINHLPNACITLFPAADPCRGVHGIHSFRRPPKFPGCFRSAFRPFFKLAAGIILLPAGVEFAFPRSEGAVLRIFLPLLSFAFLLPASSAPVAANPSANLVGVVYSEASNQRLAHVSVWLYDDGGGTRLLESVTTDNGEFAFPGIRDGAYVLKITAPGFLPLEMNVEVNFSTERGISIFLRPEGKISKEQPAGPVVSAHELSMPSAARKLADAGMKKLYARNNPEGALRDFEAAVVKAPDYYEAYYQAGMACLSLQRPAEAEKNLRVSVALSKQSYADAVLALAILLLGRHDSADGEPLLRRRLELNPNSWVGYYELGKLELYRMHLAPALDAAHSAQSLARQQPKVYRLLSLIHLRQKDYPAAIADLDAYIRLDPDSPEGQTAKQIRDDTARRLQTDHP